MLLLLPPSEGKTAPADGPPLDLMALSSPRLTAHRRRLLTALVRASRAPDALRRLGVGVSLAAEVAANTALRTAATAPAREVYSGVLFTAAGLSDLPDEESRRRADASVRIVSALWGVVRPADPIPAYRLSMTVDLPGVGPLAPSWRAVLPRVLDPEAAERLVVDCRSSSYAAAWPGPAAGPGRVRVTVLREGPGGRAPVSHWAKHTRGVLVRHLLTRPGPVPSTPQALLTAARELVGTPLLAGTRLLGAEPAAAAPGGRDVALVLG